MRNPEDELFHSLCQFLFKDPELCCLPVSDAFHIVGPEKGIRDPPPELDSHFSAPMPEEEQLLDILSCITTYFDIGCFVEAIAAAPVHQYIPVHLQPLLGDLASVRYDRDQVRFWIFFALSTQKRLAARKVDLLHSSMGEESEACLHSRISRDVGSFLSSYGSKRHRSCCTFE